MLISYGKFEQTRGNLEVKPERIRQVFPTKDAEIRVVLHQNHDRYYLAPKGDGCMHYFSLPPLSLSASRDHRSAVKQFFKENYNLEVSVRPIHTKEMVNDRPICWAYAQVQSGENTLHSCNKERF